MRKSRILSFLGSLSVVVVGILLAPFSFHISKKDTNIDLWSSVVHPNELGISIVHADVAGSGGCDSSHSTDTSTGDACDSGV